MKNFILFLMITCACSPIITKKNKNNFDEWYLVKIKNIKNNTIYHKGALLEYSKSINIIGKRNIKVVSFWYNNFLSSGGKPIFLDQKHPFRTNYPERDYLEIMNKKIFLDSLFNDKKNIEHSYYVTKSYVSANNNYCVIFLAQHFGMISNTTFLPVIFFFDKNNLKISALPSTNSDLIDCFGDFNSDGFLDYIQVVNQKFEKKGFYVHSLDNDLQIISEK